VDNRIDSSANGVGKADLRRADDRTARSTTPLTSPLTLDPIEPEPAQTLAQAITPVTSSGEDSERVAPIMRAAAFATIAFQIGYLLLDRWEYPQNFARNAPFHIASIILGFIVLTATLSSRAMQNWRATVLVILSSILASTAWIAVINGDSDVLVASIILFFFGAGALIPWSPRWQAALEAAGIFALFGYSIQSANPNSHIALDWMRLLSAALVSELSAVHITRSRMKLAEQMAALLENQHLLTREMELREESSRAREIEHSRWQQTDSMLRKVFEASPDNVAVNSLSDGRFLAVNDNYHVGGYTRDDVIGSSVIALGLWAHERELTGFLETLQQTGRVKDMEVSQRRKDGTVELHLISASVVEVNGESCVISMTRDITEIKRAELRLRNSHAALRKILHATSS
jgi:PAS domain S-box-containing protein